MSNPFNSIIELYTESVKKADAAGLSEVYKRATEVVFEGLKERFPFGLNIIDVEYLDGYFIFSRGTNSIVHFHIEETPGWKYGIWWSPVSKNTKEGEKDDKNTEYYTDRVHCSIFAQYEEEIDKFKPSASTVCEEFTIDFNYPAVNRLWTFAGDIEFIYKEPYLAFYREMHYTDFNREHVSRAKAKAYYERHFKEKKLMEETKALNDKEILDTLYEILKEDIDEGVCFIQDCGDCCTSRYEIIIKNTFGIEDGCYDIFDCFEDKAAKEMRKLWEKTIKNCGKRNKKIGHSWFIPCCDENAILLSADDYDKAFANEDIKKVYFTDN